ncbi:hypothetical protein [Chondromyces apiculatus]|uniref:Uncharacterized protein n=1 Tax=Chondromyces apiculatus DSM 436 TaxID=1192034 RepID=A0A017T571_9BACT|nr:hypothetical protein [Chondromyces apiculatus]EYF04132.1 Hypothetical protein CAP_4815 [Chondromyces apiculatus DSM 436]
MSQKDVLDESQVANAEELIVKKGREGKALDPAEIRKLLEEGGFENPVIEHVISKSNQVMKKYTAAPTEKDKKGS